MFSSSLLKASINLDYISTARWKSWAIVHKWLCTMQQIMDETERVIKCWWISNIRRNGKCLWIKYNFRWQYLDQFAWNSHKFILGNCPSERVVICTEITPSYIFGNEIWSEKVSNQQTLVSFHSEECQKRGESKLSSTFWSLYTKRTSKS